MRSTKEQRDKVRYCLAGIPTGPLEKEWIDIGSICADADLAERLEAEIAELRNRLAMISEITDKALQAVAEDSAR